MHSSSCVLFGTPNWPGTAGVLSLVRVLSMSGGCGELFGGVEIVDEPQDPSTTSVAGCQDRWRSEVCTVRATGFRWKHSEQFPRCMASRVSQYVKYMAIVAVLGGEHTY